jgi:hypothetical protein
MASTIMNAIYPCRQCPSQRTVRLSLGSFQRVHSLPTTRGSEVADPDALLIVGMDVELLSLLKFVALHAIGAHMLASLLGNARTMTFQSHAASHIPLACCVHAKLAILLDKKHGPLDD